MTGIRNAFRTFGRWILTVLHRHDPIECGCELTEADRYRPAA